MIQRLLKLCALVLLISSCSTIEPWVSPFERSKLADPIMSFARHPADAAYMHHVRQAREGARGAEGGGGGGCGCN
jgi:hypothetical protein